MSRNLWGADTSPEAARVQVAALQRMSPEQRAQMVFELSANLRRIMEAGVRQRHPEYTQRQVELGAIRLALGDELFGRVYPGVKVDC